MHVAKVLYRDHRRKFGVAGAEATSQRGAKQYAVSLKDFGISFQIKVPAVGATDSSRGKRTSWTRWSSTA